MKRLPIVIVASFAFHLTAVAVCDAGNNCLFKRRSCDPCGRPVCGSVGSTAVFEPSALNIQLTGELVALRAEVEELKLAMAKKDEALDASRELVGAQEAEASKQLEKFAKQTQRATKAEAAMAAAVAESKESSAKSAKQIAELKDNLKKLRQRNTNLKKQLDKSQQALEKSKDRLAKATKANQEKKNEEAPREEKAIQPPAAKEDAVASESDGDAEGPSDTEQDAESDESKKEE